MARPDLTRPDTAQGELTEGDMTQGETPPDSPAPTGHMLVFDPRDPGEARRSGVPGPIRFARHDTLDDLPHGPGLYVLMGRGIAGGDPVPLAFGHVAEDLNQALPKQALFRDAVAQGLTGFASAPCPAAARTDPDRLITALAERYHAPLNLRRLALQEIERAQARMRRTHPRIAAE
ncbi:hypothetical protein [Pseudooceanicola aestuarii]|uniref:hypothetical protein n=1 Tax=Pseudooceanicola aestuarii TaxID=2697319 RepID=UPI0013D0E849|nr:hypothetical protein [Pseudooceanicola aestuarii]